ncbi:MAG: rhomboid family intramembrane serine protease, partial [Kiloniellales bacterium]
SLLHLAMNSVAVLILAPLVVAVLGLKRAGVLFLLTGLAGAAASHLAGHGGAGASGAVCGAIGALLAFGKREAGLRGAVLMRAMKQWVMILVLWTVVALAANMNIDHIAHWVGFAAGLALGWWGEGGRAGRLSGAPLWNALFYAGAAAVVATAFFVGVQVQRSFHAGDVAFYNRGSFQALQRIQLRLHGGGEPLAAKLDLPDPPPGSEELDQALREAWQAVRERPSAAAAVSSFDAAELLWQAWRIESTCRYGPCANPAS